MLYFSIWVFELHEKVGGGGTNTAAPPPIFAPAYKCLLNLLEIVFPRSKLLGEGVM